LPTRRPWPIDCKFSRSIVSADTYDDQTDEVVLRGDERRKVTNLAAAPIGGAGNRSRRQSVAASSDRSDGALP
jgi:hypothetical protein